MLFVNYSTKADSGNSRHPDPPGGGFFTILWQNGIPAGYAIKQTSAGRRMSPLPRQLSSYFECLAAL